MTTKVDGTNGVLQSYDYQVLTTAFTYTFAAGTTTLIAVPAATLATGTITMPASPADGMVVTFSSTQQITALTVSANTGQTLVGTSTQAVPNQPISYIYRLTNTTWYPFAGGAGRASTLVSGTAVNAATGSPTSVTFSSIPSWVKRITVNITGVSMSGTSSLRFRLGPVAGVETSGYLGSSTGFAATTMASVQFTLGFDLNDGATAAATRNGSFVFSLLDSATNTWAMQGCQGQGNTNSASVIGGSKPLAGVLSVLSMTTTNGTDTFDAGTVNILVE